jgi:TM2 domain-containing membrane protein YozV
MTFGIESLFISLAFLIPGFLTSKLIFARTPAAGKDVSTFQETLESLLRSVCIHILIIPIVFFLVKNFLIDGDAALISRINNNGIQAYYSARPFEATLVLFTWLFGAFVLAIFFGYVWDPLEALFAQLVKRTGSASEDIFYQLSKQVLVRRAQGHAKYQLWVQAPECVNALRHEN